MTTPALPDWIGPPPAQGGPGAWLAWAAQEVAGYFAMDFALYLGAAGFWFLLLWVLLRRAWAGRRIQPDYPDRAQIRREFLWSLATLGVFALVALGTAFVVLAGWSRFYVDPFAYHWLWLPGSFLALVVLHDAWFYWTHRLMHLRGVYKWTHRTHHRSVNPSPFAAYSFAPAEAFVQALFAPLALMLVPTHPVVFMLFMLHEILRNALGHSGFEIYPASWQRHPLLRWVNTASHHHLHHATLSGNYGLYFLWWDRMCGTERRESVETFERAARGRAGPAPAPAEWGFSRRPD